MDSKTRNNWVQELNHFMLLIHIIFLKLFSKRILPIYTFTNGGTVFSIGVLGLLFKNDHYKFDA